jgi:hypothetical protein
MISGGIETFVSGQEFNMVAKFENDDKILTDNLTESEEVIMNKLVRKGVYDFHSSNGVTYYSRNVNGGIK